MQKKTLLTTLSLTALVFAGFATDALADQRGGNRHEAGMMQFFDFDALDADKDGKVTKAEIDANRLARTKAADANGDGLLSAEELAAMRMQDMQTRALIRAKMMVERMDSDGDGMLSAAELAVQPGPARMFDRIDTDNDGALTAAELDAAKARMRDRMGMHRMGNGQGQGMSDDE